MEHSIISISVEKELLERIERQRKAHGFKDRSEFWRKAVNHYLGEFEKEGMRGNVRGALMIVHDEEKDEAVHAVQHARIVTTHLHNHFKDRSECLEVFIVEGEGREVERIIGILRKEKSVRYAQFVKA